MFNPFMIGLNYFGVAVEYIFRQNIQFNKELELSTNESREKGQEFLEQLSVQLSVSNRWPWLGDSDSGREQ